MFICDLSNTLSTLDVSLDVKIATKMITHGGLSINDNDNDDHEDDGDESDPQLRI